MLLYFWNESQMVQWLSSFINGLERNQPKKTVEIVLLQTLLGLMHDPANPTSLLSGKTAVVVFSSASAVFLVALAVVCKVY